MGEEESLVRLSEFQKLIVWSIKEQALAKAITYFLVPLVLDLQMVSIVYHQDQLQLLKVFV